MTSTFLERGLALVRNGYRIIPIPAGRKGPVEDDWENFEADETLVERWAKGFKRANRHGEEQFVSYTEGNIGILTERTPAVDLDILDETFALEMQSVVERIVDASLPLPVRIGRAPKRLLLFLAAEPFTKVQSSFFIDPAGAKHRVEILGAGQQFVAYGIHPDTGKPFHWVTPENPMVSPIDELPTLSRDQARRIVEEFEARAAKRGWRKVALAFKGSFEEAGSASSTEDIGIDMRPKLRVSADDLREALALMDGFDDYETWFRVGMGLHHQFGGDDEGYELWDEWSQRAKDIVRQGKSVYDPDALRYRWNESFKQVKDGGHGPITCAFILKNANEKRKEQAEALFAELQASVSSCLDFQTLMGPVAKEIASADITSVQRSVLTKQMQKMAKKFTGVLVALKDIAKATAPRIADEGERTRDGEELEVALARRVMRTRFEDGAYLKRFSKMWWTYQDGVWRQEEEEYIDRCVLETLTDLRRINDKTLRELIGQMDESRGDRLNALVSTVSSVMSKLVAEQGKNDPMNLNSFDAPRVINCTNCEVWVDDDGEITTQEHNPIHLLTSQLACDYDPLAACPTWDAAIRKVFQDCDEPEEVIRHFYEIFGYIAQPTREQALWVLFKGPGGNGKSFLLGIITEIMGRGSVIGKSISEIASNTNSHFTMQLIGKLMLFDDDVKKGVLLPDDWIKKLSEAKLLTADPKFGSPFEFIARSIPTLLSNSWPATTDLSEGIRRRVQVFESTHILTDDEKDPQHLRTIRTHELSGILSHLIGGLQRFLARGGKFKPPGECIESKERWLSSSNTTMRFISECVERITDRNLSVRASDLYEHYSQWLRHWETGAKPLGRNKFYEAMDSLGLRRANHSNVWYFSGIKLRLLDDTTFEDLDADDGLGDDGL